MGLQRLVAPFKISSLLLAHMSHRLNVSFCDLGCPSYDSPYIIGKTLKKSSCQKVLDQFGNTLAQVHNRLFNIEKYLGGLHDSSLYEEIP